MDDKNSIIEILQKHKPAKVGTGKRVDIFDSVENNFETDIGLLNQDHKHLNFDL